jgi:N-succinyl-L-ornithine transcarbamylase
MGLLFLNPSMRTRLSTQIAASNLGMETIVFNVGQEGWSLEFEEETIMSGTTVEHVKDAAPILGKYFDILGVRTFPSLKDKSRRLQRVLYQAVCKIFRHSGREPGKCNTASAAKSLTDIITITETSLRKSANQKLS